MNLSAVEGEFDHHPRATGVAAPFYRRRAAVCFDDGPNDRQSETCAAGRTGAGTIRSEEAIEDLGDGVLGDPGTVVRDDEANAVIAVGDTDLDGRALRCVDSDVRQEVRDDLGQAFSIGRDGDR